MHWLAIALGGALGAMARYGLGIWVTNLVDHRMPLGTLIVNIIGSFAIGLVYVGLVEKGLLPPEWRLFVITGFLGAFTTFSTFSLDALHLWQDGQIYLALGYVLLSVVCSLVAVALAVNLGQKVF